MIKENRLIHEKECSVCGISKPLTEYHRHKSQLDGFRRDCKACRSEEGRKYRNNNSDKVLKAKKEWYRDTKKLAEERTLEQLKEVSKPCTQCNQDKPIEEYRKRTNGGFYSICKKCENYNNKIYRKENPDIINAIKVVTEQRRRRRAEGLISDFTLQEWKDCKEYFNSECAYCGREMHNLTQDHFIPLTKDGGYTKSNIIPACRSCNCKKHNIDFENWYHKQSFYSKDREIKIMNYLDIQ